MLIGEFLNAVRALLSGATSSPSEMAVLCCD